MQSDMDDIGGAKELALHRLEVAYEDLTSAKRNYKESDYRTAYNGSVVKTKNKLFLSELISILNYNYSIDVIPICQAASLAAS